MDVRVHRVTEVTEQINIHNSDYKFVTRTLRIIDENGNEYSLTMFADDKRNLTTHKFEEEIHA
jgi:predicted acetyltransferase